MPQGSTSALSAARSTRWELAGLDAAGWARRLVSRRSLEVLDVVMAGAVVVLSFLPYAAVSLGENTNLPFSALACAYVIVRRLDVPVVLWSAAGMVLLPFAATYLRTFAEPHPILIGSYVVWVLSVLSTPGMIAAMLILRRRMLPLLSTCIALSSIMALVQAYFLDKGVMPWLWYYGAKGYRSVAEWSAEILQYHPRPFGLFPEPSFMAGTLALACILMVALCIWWDQPYTWREWGAMLLTIPVLVLSVSGSASVTLVVLAGCFVLPLMRRSPVVVAVTPIVIGAGLYGGYSLLTSRTEGNANSSWTDRSASIIIAFQPFLHDVWAFLLGIGNGMANLYFLMQKFPLHAADHYAPLPDMFSVIGRVVVENGILLSGPMLLWMVWGFVSGRGFMRKAVGLGALVSWLVVAGLTISYYSAFWLWGMPGAMIALRILPEHMPTERSRG